MVIRDERVRDNEVRLYLVVFKHSVFPTLARQQTLSNEEFITVQLPLAFITGIIYTKKDSRHIRHVIETETNSLHLYPVNCFVPKCDKKGHIFC